MSSRTEHPLPRFTALLAVLCVLALAVFAASPELHAGLHAATGTEQSAPVGDADHLCAVTLFASGLTALLVFGLLLLGHLVARGILVHAADEFAAAHPRYRLVPAHAPPAA
jgi:hypothetical protein